MMKKIQFGNDSVYEKSLQVVLTSPNFEVTPMLPLEFGRTVVGEASLAVQRDSLNYASKEHLSLVNSDVDGEYYTLEMLVDKAHNMGIVEEMCNEPSVTIFSDSHPDTVDGEYRIIDMAKQSKIFEGVGVDENGDPENGRTLYLKPVKLTLTPVDDGDDE